MHGLLSAALTRLKGASPDRLVPASSEGQISDSQPGPSRRDSISTAVAQDPIADAELRRIEEHFRWLVDSVKDYAIIMLDPHGRVVTWNEGAQRLKGYTHAEILGQSMECFYSAKAVAAGTPARLLALAAANGRCEDEGWRLRKDGTSFFADVVLTAVHDAAGELVGFIKITRDITERKQAEDALRTSERRYRLLADDTADVIMLIDSEFSERLYVSPACRHLYGYEPDELINIPVGKLVHPDDRVTWQDARSRLPNLPENEVMQTAYRVLRKDGSGAWVEASRRRLPGNHGFLVSIRDVSERREFENQLKIHALRDELTGLANRQCFDEILGAQFRRAMREGTSLSLIMIEIDFFKHFTDHYGHAAGDDCLKAISEAIKQAVHRPADLAARYGGEEFAVLLPNTPEAGALVIAERIRQAVRLLQIEHAASQRKIVTLSSGVESLVPERDVHRLDDLVSAADRALYAAKADGRDVVFSASMPRMYHR